MNKNLLIPIVALVLLMVKQFTNIEFTTEEVDTIIQGVLAIIIAIGFFTEPKKKTSK
jgi:uncharacterized membrane protein